MASAHDCTSSSVSDAPGSRQAGYPMPPDPPSHVWYAQPCPNALSLRWPPFFLLLLVTPWTFRMSRRADLWTTLFCLRATSLKGALTLQYTQTHTLVYYVSPSWCNVSESRRSGEAGAEQRASGLVLGPSPKHCLTECRGGQDRTTKPLLQRLHLPPHKHTCILIQLTCEQTSAGHSKVPHSFICGSQ